MKRYSTHHSRSLGTGAPGGRSWSLGLRPPHPPPALRPRARCRSLRPPVADPPGPTPGAAVSPGSEPGRRIHSASAGSAMAAARLRGLSTNPFSSILVDAPPADLYRSRGGRRKADWNHCPVCPPSDKKRRRRQTRSPRSSRTGDFRMPQETGCGVRSEVWPGYPPLAHSPRHGPGAARTPVSA